MPYAIPVGSVLEMRLRCVLFGQTVINVFHYRNNVAYEDGAAALVAAVADFNAVVWSAIHPALTNQVVEAKVDAQWVFATRFRVLTTPLLPLSGTNAGTTTQTGTAAVIKRFGEQANRHNQGRIYLYGCPVEQQLDGQWKSIFINNELSDCADAVKANIQTAIDEPLQPVLWSPLDPMITYAIVGSGVNPIIRYQRRREIGVGQ